MSRFGHTKRAKEIKRKARRQAKEARKRKRREEAHSGGFLEDSEEESALYAVMADAGALTSTELAERSGMAEPHVHGWLIAQVAAGSVSYDPESDRYLLKEGENHQSAGPSSPPVSPADEADQ